MVSSPAPSVTFEIVSKTAPAEVTDEETFTYILRVRNAGPSDAEGVVVEDELPDGVRFVSSEGCDPPNAQGVVICDIGDLGKGATTKLRIVVKAKQPGERINRATVSGDTPDPNDQNNADGATTQVNEAPPPSSADLAIDKRAPAEAKNGQKFNYTLTVTNDGPSDARRVFVTDRLPARVQFVSAPNNCRNDAGAVRCNLGTVSSGDRTRTDPGY